MQVTFTNKLNIVYLHLIRLIYYLTIYIAHVFNFNETLNLSLFQDKWFSNVFEAGYAVLKRALANIFRYIENFEKSDPCQPPAFLDVMRSIRAVRAVAESAAIMEEWYPECWGSPGQGSIGNSWMDLCNAKAYTFQLGSLFQFMEKTALELKNSPAYERRQLLKGLEFATYFSMLPWYSYTQRNSVNPPPPFIPLGGSFLPNVGYFPPLHVPMSFSQRFTDILEMVTLTLNNSSPKF